MIIKSTTKPENQNPAIKDDKDNWHKCSKAVWTFLSNKTLPLDCEITAEESADGEQFIVKAVPKKQEGFNPANSYKKQEEKVDWDKLAFGKCKYGFLIEAFKMGKSLAEAERECEAWAKASMRQIE